LAHKWQVVFFGAGRPDFGPVLVAAHETRTGLLFSRKGHNLGGRNGQNEALTLSAERSWRVILIFAFLFPPARS